MAKKTNPEETVHIRINRPIECRRTILQNSISIIDMLKRYETILHIRREKELAMEKFKKELRGVNRLVRTIRLKDMPLEMHDLKKVRTVTRKPAIKTKKGKTKKRKTVKTKKLKNPLDKQMDDIKRKLNTL